MRGALLELRRTIIAAAPDAEEVISYRMPALRHQGILVYYAAFRDHCSFFPGSLTTQRKFASELKPFPPGKGTLRFTPDRPIPPALVKRIVRARVLENGARSKRRTEARGSRRRR